MVCPITLGLNILINGPFAVGIPVLARTRFSEGAAAFGLIMSLFGGGALLGTTLAGILPKPSKKLLGTVALSVISMMGIGLAVIGVSPTMYVAAAAGLLMGIANGYAHSRRKVEALFGQVFRNDDDITYQAAQRVLRGEHRWLEQGIAGWKK